MQIESLEIFHVALPLCRPMSIAGRELDTLETVLVRMQSGDTAGWGEASPGNAPRAVAEWAAGVFGCLRDWLAPAVLSGMIDSGDELTERLDAFRGNRFAKAALDMAWWDLKARREGRPLHELLGGQRRAIELGVSFDQMESTEAFLAMIGQVLDAGFSRVSLMFRPGWEVEMVDAVRKEFPVAELQIDAEEAMGLQHMDTIHRLEDFALAAIEQPFPADDLVGHAMAQESLRTPICLDEGITTVAQAEMALDLKSCRVVNLEPGKVGGLTPAVAIHDACRAAEVPCYVGAMPQSALGQRIGLALAAKSNCSLPADYVPCEELFAEDLAERLLPERDQTDGTMRINLWPEPGLGVDPEPEALEKLCLARVKVE